MIKFFASSVDSTKLATTFKGILIGLIPLAIFFSKFQGVSLTEIELMEIINSIDGVIMALGGLVSACMTLYGLLRKLFLHFKK